ncbi:sulfotransferase family protein [Sphingobacterium sp. LRF_L2]|uniref:sulfotransferase family protein n=1 Tax=Sphingobacterium sp. LRF_L2 TaxID=3369421 RepID=UPI003F6243DF
MNISGVQMIGTQRSGSNLLRIILNQSTAVVSPHPAHLLVNFMPLLPYYEPLDANNYRRLVEDVISYIAVNPVQWDVALDVDKLFSMSAEFSLFELNKNIYRYLAAAKHASVWCCKSMANVYYASALEKNYPSLKYIYLYRDGRDVALSFQKAIVGEKHIYHIAKQWHEDQQACLALQARFPKERFYELNYENLIRDPEYTVRGLCDFLGLVFSENMLDFHTSDESKRTAAGGKMWHNLTRPIMQENSNKFLTEMSMEDILIFESVAGESLKALGYKLLFEQKELRQFSKEEISEFDVLNKKGKIAIKMDVGDDDLKKREGQLEIINGIKTGVQVL